MVVVQQFVAGGVEGVLSDLVGDAEAVQLGLDIVADQDKDPTASNNGYYL